ncbi:MAG: hypothetical protein R3A46_02170 [Thermomicrobiales bacterium]
MNANSSGPSGDALASACGAGYRIFDDPRLSAAVTLVGGANQVTLTGTGDGFAVADFGAVAFREIGVSASAVHAGDLATTTNAPRPGDTLIGIDSDSRIVARALRRARHAGVHTVCLTTRDLTIVDADVILSVPAPLTDAGMDIAGTVACGLTLALTAARLEPETTLAGEVGNLEKSVRRVVHDAQPLSTPLTQALAGGPRLFFSGQGTSSWVAEGLARRLMNGRATSSRATIVAVAQAEIDEGLWSFAASDILIEIDPEQHPPGPVDRRIPGTPSARPENSWSLGRRRNQSSYAIHLPAASAAMRSLIAFVALTLLKAQIASDHPAERDDTNV